MSRRYDTRTTTFSPEGRLYQVEYAMEAISQAGACIGILAKDGILLAVENRQVHKLLDSRAGAEKIYKLSDNIACSVAGVTGDANVLVNMLRAQAQRYELSHNEQIPVQQLVEYVADHKQFYTQQGGKRPFGVSLLYMGWDDKFNYQLYMSDPSGNYNGWKSMCIGKNSQAAISMLKQEYKEGIDLEAAEKLCIKILAKTLDFKLAPEKVEFTTLTRVNDKTVFTQLPSQRIQTLIEEHERIEKEKEEAAAQKAKP